MTLEYARVRGRRLAGLGFRVIQSALAYILTTTTREHVFLSETWCLITKPILMDFELRCCCGGCADIRSDGR